MKKFIQIFVCCIFALAAVSCLQKPDEPNTPGQGTTQNGGTVNGGSTNGGTNNGGNDNDDNGGTNNGGTTNGGNNDEPLAYYLCGNFAGVDYAYGKDASNLGDFIFMPMFGEAGCYQTFVSFTGSKNYVCVKDNKGHYYMFDRYLDDSYVEGQLHDYGTSMYEGEKMLVPGPGDYIFYICIEGGEMYFGYTDEIYYY